MTGTTVIKLELEAVTYLVNLLECHRSIEDINQQSVSHAKSTHILFSELFIIQEILKRLQGLVTVKYVGSL